MNDFELNKAIAETQFPSKGWGIYKDDPEYPELLYVRYKDGSHYKHINYLKNWNDLMPLVVEYGINLNCYSSTNEWHAFIYPHGINNESPQRALAECLLKVLTQGEDDE